MYYNKIIAFQNNIDNLKKDHWIDDYKLLESLAQQNLNSGDKGAYVLKQKWLQKGCNKQKEKWM